MNDFSDLLLAMGAMVLYSILLLNTNSAIVRSESIQVENEIEYTAISLAQSVIDEARVKSFNGSSKNSGLLKEFVDESTFNELNGRSSTIETSQEVPYQIDLEVYYVSEHDPKTPVSAGVQTPHQLLTVTVSSDYMDNEIRLEYLKTDYE